MKIKSKKALPLALASLLFSGTSAAAVNLCEGLITGNGNYPMTNLARPGYLKSAIDPQFGTKITRVSASTDVVKPAYSTMPVWNADESLMILWDRSKQGHVLLDGKTYEFIRELSETNPTDIEHMAWHATNPDLVFYPESGYSDGDHVQRFMQYNVKTRKTTLIHDFSDIITSGSYNFGYGGDPMYSSWDSDVWGFADQEGPNKHFAYRLSTDTVSPLMNKNGPEHPAPGPSGEYFYWQAGIYDFNMNLLHTLNMDNPDEHAVLGRLKNGHDAWFGIQFDGNLSGTLVTYDMVTGEGRVVVGEETGFPYPPSGHHFSAVRTQPGWTAVSIIGYDEDGQSLLDNEIILVNANEGEEVVCRVAHHRSRREGGRGYWSEPHANVSPSGTRIAFASDWGTNKVDTYVVELPAYDPDSIPDYEGDTGGGDSGSDNFVKVSRGELNWFFLLFIICLLPLSKRGNHK